MFRINATSFLVAISVPAVVIVGLTSSPQPAHAAPPGCAAYTQPVFQRLNPQSGAQLITANAAESDQAGAHYGYTQDNQVAFRASTSGTGTVVVRRLTRSSPTDAVWTADAAEIARLTAAGYRDAGGNFLAGSQASPCLVEVRELTKGGLHRQGADPTLIESWQRAGWTLGPVSFYAAPASSAPVSSAPSASAPVSSAPSASAPASPAPSASAPASSAPSASAPASPAPSASAPVSPAPSASASASPAPSATANAALPTGPTDLDATGRTIPDSNYAIPAGAIFIAPSGNDAERGTKTAPVRTLARAIALAPGGGTIVFRGGTYRDAYRSGSTYAIAYKGLTLQAYPHEKPWLDGSDVVAASRWTSDGHGHWSTAWSTPEFCGGRYYDAPPTSSRTACTYPDMIHGTATNPVPADPQQVFADGVRQRQSATLAGVSATTFYYDWSARQLYIGVNPASRTIELSRRPMALVLAGNSRNYVLGLGFRRYASYGNEGVNGAVYVGGFTTVKDSAFVDNAGLGLAFSLRTQPSSVSHSVFVGNSYTGLAANGTSEKGSVPDDDFLLADSLFDNNNAEDLGVGCTVSCGQAAVKFAHLRGYTVTGNLIENTGGGAVGLWCDLDCTSGVLTRNVVRDQPKSSGIFVEVGATTIVADNLVTGNLYGISVASATTKIYNNTVVDNVQAIRIYDDHRSRGMDWGGKIWHDVGPDTTGVEVRNNLTYSTSYSVIAFPMTPGSIAPNTGAEAFFASIDHNVLFQASDKNPTFVQWTTLSGKTTAFKSRAALTEATGFDGSGVWVSGVDPFVNRAGRDYRLKSAYVGLLKPAPLPADVAAALGVRAGTTVLAGAALRR